ncbi:MAG: hypothetical protein COS36_06810 [Candidatus Altarchaeum sp. CG03_land_8_20_14_0_80_32_618]|nr:MAG: hypothetical protein COS36_06810 [Candidatus Altarchaeum sp. CG03_land_8_20_14_0_80_32_618]PIZ30997.1 MAG: hypothetical protein COY41_03165 [Candidatus Altarchaeum sp. CG_4_10_14_0_8_um_filter_32_851]
MKQNHKNLKMPAILIHLAFGYILYWLFSFKFRKLKDNYFLFLFLLGSLIPDIKYFVAWLTYLIFGSENFVVFSSLAVTHQIFGSFLVSLLLAATLFRNKFKISLVILTVGFLGHFFLDISQYPFASIGHMQLFYPFSAQIFYINFGFINGIQVFEVFQYLVLIVAIILFISSFIRDKTRNNHNQC